MKKLLFLGFFIIIPTFHSLVFAQVKTVSGKVTSQEDSTPLPGVNVLIKGTASGTVTDIEGNYRMEVEEGQTLTFTFIGLVPQEILVGAPNVYDLQLRTDVRQLSEVIVTG
ncbi:MAG: carboxypeptidase-like regulatory domain-containing protein, partial [Bacteroidota bacterium]|nr:carboxypeptidase-like regulatory domain-containing protein [Bacteroidota bacterium]